MRTRLVLAGTAAAGIALLAVAGPPEETAGFVVLNRDPPPAPSWGLEWQAFNPAPAAAAKASEVARKAAEEEPFPDHAYGHAGVWATPAEFAEPE